MATNPKDLTDEELFDEIERRLGSRRSFKAFIDRIARAWPGKGLKRLAACGSTAFAATR